MVTEVIFVVKTNPLNHFLCFSFSAFLCVTFFYQIKKKLLTELTISIARTNEMNIQINPLEEEIQQLKQNKINYKIFQCVCVLEMKRTSVN